MASNVDRYKADLARLIKDGDLVRQALALEAYGHEYEAAILEHLKGDESKRAAFIKKIPNFKIAYNAWYSEALALVRQLLPDRLDDFVRLHDKPKSARKEITYENYRIEDALQGLRVSLRGDVIADQKAALPLLDQQLAIVAAIQRRFDSSLFEIEQLVQADLLDSELEAAKLLAKHKFLRAAGAIAGVVLEKHLSTVAKNHNVKIAKKHPTIADLNEALKTAGVIDVPQWRFNQHLADIRNLCDHNKATEPTAGQVDDLIDGVSKVIKTLH